MLCIEVHSNTICTKLETIINRTQGYSYCNLARGTGFRQDSLELLIIITIQSHSWTQSSRHLEWENAITSHTIGAEAFELAIAIQETQSIAISKAGSSCYIKRVVTNLFNPAHKLAYCLWGVKGCNIWLATIHKISGIAAIESAIKIGSKRVLASSFRSTTILIRMLTDKGVKSLAICSCDILDVSHIL